jgi:hypothetical protein
MHRAAYVASARESPELQDSRVNGRGAPSSAVLSDLEHGKEGAGEALTAAAADSAVDNVTAGVDARKKTQM